MHIIQVTILTVSNDGLAAFLEFFKVIHDFTAKECTAILQRRLIDNDCCTLRLDTLHDALNGGLSAVVRVRLHGEAVYTNYTRLLLCLIILVVLAISIILTFTKT